MRRRSRPGFDPRVLVTAVFAVVLVLVTTTTTILVRSAHQTRGDMHHLRVSVRAPLGDLGATLEADTAGQALLQRAAAVTGEERGSLLAESIAAAEMSARSWTSYRARALGLPGEAELADKYERDYAAAKEIAGRVLVPIIQSGVPMSLPAEQVAAAELDRQDLVAIHALYDRETEATLRSLDERVERLSGAIRVGAITFGLLLLAGFVLAFRAGGRAAANRRAQSEAAELAVFEASLLRALEFADDDDAAFRVAARALTEKLPDAEVSMAVADATQVTFTPIVSATSCGVETVEQCRAARAGGPLQFSDSGALDTCPVLAAGATTRCAVTCVPVSVAGIQAAIVQLTGPVDEPPDLDGDVALIVRRLGDRITTMRAFARFQLQAAHDPLTGLLNRRSLEEAVARLTADDTPYAVAFADLDHFKLLNDVHGHDAGDRALRAFATTLKTALRPADLVGRWGGEEFVAILPDCGQEDAVDAMDRVRARLGMEVAQGSTLDVTVSVGVAVRRPAEPFEQAVARADQALLRAKEEGRDRVVLWSSTLDLAAIETSGSLRA